MPERTKFVEHSVSTENTTFILRTAGVLDIESEELQDGLAEYVLTVQQDPSGDTIRFALKPEVRVNTMAAGEHLFVDFLPQTWKEPNPPVPERILRKLEARAEHSLEDAQAQADEEGTSKLEVSVARHPAHTRFVFNWNLLEKSDFSLEADEAILTFNKSDIYDFSTINADPPALVKRVETSNTPDKTRVSLKLAKDAKVRTYEEDSQIIIDITHEKLAKNNDDAVNSPSVIDELPPQSRNIESGQETIAKELAELPDGPRGSEKPEKEALTATPKHIQANGAEKVSRPEHAVNPKAAEADRKKLGKVVKADVFVNPANGALRIYFPFSNNETPSAVFRRDKAVWIAFKTEHIVDVSALEAVADTLVRKVDVIEQGNFKAIRLGLPNAQLATSGIEGNAWVVAIGTSVLGTSESLNLSRNTDKNGLLFLTTDLAGASGHVEIDDPVVGDKLHVVLAEPPGRGLLRSQQFAKFKFLPSAHGIALASFLDKLDIKLHRDRVNFKGKVPLNLSPTNDLPPVLRLQAEAQEWYDFPP